MYQKTIGFFLFLLLTAACSQPKNEKVDVLITNATVVDVTNGVLLADRFIAISDDTIKTVDEMAAINRYDATTKIDVDGKYVMPGLWDNHVHFRGGDSLIIENKDLLPLFLVHGVTTIRDAGGDITPAVLQWKEAIENGAQSGPQIFTSGPKLDGDDPAWPGSIQVVDAADVVMALDSLENLAVDYVKMYDGNLTKEAYYGIIREAESRGLKTTGHMPMQANILEAVDYGLDGSEHLYYVLKACSPLADSLTALNIGYGMLGSLIESYDPDLAQDVFKKLGEDDFYVTPTLYIGKVLAEVLDVDHTQDELLPYIGAGIQKTYQRRVEAAKRAKASGSNTRSRLEMVFKEMIRPMFDAGVNILAGSDCGPYNSFVYPGESIHGELAQLVAGGLTPKAALMTSFQKGPEFFGVEKYYGSIEAGKIGDLVVLEKNPLEDIDHTRTVYAVRAGSRFYDKAALDDMLKTLLEKTIDE